MTESKKPENPHAKAYAAFVEQTKNHQLVVLHEDGLYRHLRIQEPGTRAWSWDITTWPGHLATSGDVADGYTFSREEDMIRFFSYAGRGDDGYYADGAPSIDVRYWAEKLGGGRSTEVKSFDPDHFVQLVRENLEESEALGTEAQGEYDRQLALLRKLYDLTGSGETALTANLAEYRRLQGVVADNVGYGRYTDRNRSDLARAKETLWSTESLTDEQHDVLSADPDWHELGDTDIPATSPAVRRQEILNEARYHADSEHEARDWLSENEKHLGGDTWEWDLRDWDFHFLLTCYCIAFGVRLYLQHVKTHDTNDTYIYVRDGRVQNRPARPVIDVSFLDYGVPDAEEAREALATRKAIMASPQAKLELPETIRELTELIHEHGDEHTRTEFDEIVDQEMAVAERVLAHHERQEAARQKWGEADAARSAAWTNRNG
jgi:hypothetical protein